MHLLLLALATFASEDLACAAAGALIAHGQLGFLPGTLACLAGICTGDLLLYLAGRFLGRPVARRFVPANRLDQASAWIRARGARVVLASRFTPGLRLPTYLAAGLLKTSFPAFALYFLLAASLWTPALVAATVFFGARLPLHWAGVALCLLIVLPRVPWRRLARWEFWPVWMAYLPLAPWWLWLALRHRSFTVFTLANPGIPGGGLRGESKSEILAHLPWVPRYAVVPPDGMFEPANYPVVCKPDVGERGRGVAIVRTAGELRDYLATASGPTIVQQYVSGEEFGVFYYRYPGEPEGRIYSITRKLFPRVMGDGRSSVKELIARDPRARRIASAYLAQSDGARVPGAGESVPLVEIGSHCRGTVFLDGADLETEALRRAIDGAARAHPGFYFGRFDLRAESAEALQAGRFHILELNGVAAEATHIYDPAVSVWEAYRVLFRQWRIAFEIGARCRAVLLVRAGRLCPAATEPGSATQGREAAVRIADIPVGRACPASAQRAGM